MTAQDNLNKFQFLHTSANDTPEGDHMLLAHRGKPAEWSGVLTWDGNTVQNINVKKGARGQGLATELWHQAREISPGIAHSDDRTEAGEGWSEAVGGPRPARRINSAGL